MAEQVVVVTAIERGLARFTETDCRRMTGATFPVTDAAGAQIAEGTIVACSMLDRAGSRVSIRYRVPDGVLWKGVEPDAGTAGRVPLPFELP